MHFPVFLSSLHYKLLGKLGVVFSGTQTRFILPYEASPTFRNPFRFQLPPHRTSRSRSCFQLVVAFRRPHSGLPSPSSSSCPTHAIPAFGLHRPAEPSTSRLIHSTSHDKSVTHHPGLFVTYHRIAPPARAGTQGLQCSPARSATPSPPGRHPPAEGWKSRGSER